MQLISHGLSLAAASAMSYHPRFSEFLQREEVRHFVTFLAIVLAVGQVAHIFALWAASKGVAEKKKSTLGNAAKVWLFGLLVAVGVIGSLAIAIPLTWHAGHTGLVFVLAGCGFILWLVLAFLIPMKVYDIGFLGASGLLLLTGVINGGASKAFETILVPALHLEKDVARVKADAGKTQEEQLRFVGRLFGKEAPDEIDRLLDDALHPIGPQPPVAEREAMVRNLQQKLTARQHSLKPADPRGQAIYQEQLKRYLQFRNDVAPTRKAT